MRKCQHMAWWTGLVLAVWPVFCPLFCPVAVGQQVGNWIPEVHPDLPTWQCTVAGGCQQKNTKIVLDAKYRWLHVDGTTKSCKDNALEVNGTYCYDEESCFHNCVYEGANYTDASVRTNYTGGKDSSITLGRYVGTRQATPRVYLLDETEQAYQNVILGPGTEFTFDIDTSKVPAGTIGAVYLIQMNLDGGKAEYNEGGAAMGTGYCDCQCHVRDFYNGVRNTNNSGACCPELDFWEANRIQTSLGPHPCKFRGMYPCKGKQCTDAMLGGLCNHYGCGFQLFSKDPTCSYGEKRAIDSSRPMTVITQFLTHASLRQEDKNHKTPSNAKNSDIGAIRRYYLQDGKMIRTARRDGKTIYMQSTDSTCQTQSQIVAGGMPETGRFLERGTVLSLSIFGTGTYTPLPAACLTGDEQAIAKCQLDTEMTVSNIRWGELGSTFKQDGSMDW